MTMIFRAAVFALLLSSASAFAADTLSERIAKVESGLLPGKVIKGRPVPVSTIAARMAELKVPGVSVAVINKGAIEWAKGYGQTEAGGKQAVTASTLFQAASISKPVAALAALRLAEQGKLPLDEDVNSKLVGWKVPAGAQTSAAPVTMRNLLNHSAGTTVHGFPGYAAGESVPTLLQVLDGVKPANTEPVRVAAKPGADWKYSGGGFSIAQLAMTSASGKPFAALMQDSVLAPLGMKHSTYAQPLPPAMHAQAASGHDRMGRPLPGKWHTYPEQAAAGLWTTPSDLARFAIDLQQANAGASKKVVSQAMAKQMLTRVKGQWGLGIEVDQADALPTFSHGGANAGFRASMFAYTTKGQGAVIMTNSDNGGAIAADIMRSIAKTYGWNEYTVTEKEIAAVDPAILSAYAGNYQLDDMKIVVTREGERLFIAAPPLGPERREIYPSSATSFFNLQDDMQFEFEKAAEGQFDLVIMAGRERRAKRVL